MSLTKEDLIKARQAVSANECKDNYMVITFGYSDEIILPYKDGVSLMSTLNKAEQLSGSYDDKRISPIDKSIVEARIMSRANYELHKMAVILNVSVKDMKKFSEIEVDANDPF